jgi:hypothetical protein
MVIIGLKILKNKQYIFVSLTKYNYMIKLKNTTETPMTTDPLLGTVNLKPKELFLLVKPEYEKYYRLYNGDVKADKLTLAYCDGFVTINSEGLITKCRAIQFERYMNQLKANCG